MGAANSQRGPHASSADSALSLPSLPPVLLSPPAARSYYTLIVLPELLQQLLSSWPTLLHRIGFAEGYKLRGWRTATWSWVSRAFPPSEAATPAEAEGGRAGKPAAASAACAACMAGDCTAGSQAGSAGKADSIKGSAASAGAEHSGP